MFSALAAAIAPRKRGLASGSPPPFLAAIEISLIRRVKILPRLASSAPFLCLMVAHFEWPDMMGTSGIVRETPDYTTYDFRFSISVCPKMGRSEQRHTAEVASFALERNA